MAAGAGLRAALTQWHATADVSANLAKAVGVMRGAAADGAELVLLPENGLCLGSGPAMRDAALSLDGPELDRLREEARAEGVAVVVGGFKRRVAGDELVRNTAAVIGADGEVAGLYDKIHLFDANVGGAAFRASAVERPGERPLVADVGGLRLGVTICYDLRFPELYRNLALAGADVLLVPAAFTAATGPPHWETLLRARAIENGAWVLASATLSTGADGFATHGHALAVDPWGSVVADLGQEAAAWRVVDLSAEAVAAAREKLPVLAGVRPAAQAAPEVVAVKVAGHG